MEYATAAVLEYFSNKMKYLQKYKMAENSINQIGLMYWKPMNSKSRRMKLDIQTTEVKRSTKYGIINSSLF